MYINTTMQQPPILPKPLTSKTLIRCGSTNYRVGLASMQGWRVDMEDTHAIQTSLPNHPESGFFAVYDGHGGSHASNYLHTHFNQRIDQLNDVHCKRSITDALLLLDSELEKSPETYNLTGSTVCFASITVIHTSHESSYKITVGNVGDSRAMLISRKGCKSTLPLTKDHKPGNKKEKERIKKAGGCVIDNRVSGALSVSRAFGDLQFKTPKTNPPHAQMVTCIPDFTVTTANASDLLFIGCDGIFENDVFTHKTLGQFISEALQHTDDLASICANIIDQCLSRGSFDNMTAMLVQLQDGTSYHTEVEYHPGPYHVGLHMRAYQRAYIADAARAGYTLNEAHQLYKLSQTNKLVHRYQQEIKNRRNKPQPDLTTQQPDLTTQPTYKVIDIHATQTRRSASGESSRSSSPSGYVVIPTDHTLSPVLPPPSVSPSVGVSVMKRIKPTSGTVTPVTDSPSLSPHLKRIEHKLKTNKES
eukprot:TRINITY_DN5827_c0_g1_i1.p1 TRINITY_DN5827_c0_g1~~TRINITY_DN5827_c0_g1_i1.p1  ORF type:complete len:475 (-),score=83.65 TRINITY_DN5827_c0_g1_i1:83-1507(-)